MIKVDVDMSATEFAARDKETNLYLWERKTSDSLNFDYFI